MKKTYINPELVVIKIATVQMLADSLKKVGEIEDPLAPALELDLMGQ